MFVRAEFKLTARARLKKQWRSALLLTVLTLAVLGPLGAAFTQSGYGWPLLPAMALVVGSLYLAGCRYALPQVEEDADDARLFFAALANPLRGALAALWQMLWLLLWSVCLIVPAVVKLCAYSMQFFLLADNPRLSITDSLNLSQKLTAGYKWEIFNLALSFVGWLLVSLLTMGVGLLWLLPYWQSVWAEVYDFLKMDALVSGRASRAELGLEIQTPALALEAADHPAPEEAAEDDQRENNAAPAPPAFSEETLKQAAIIAQAALHSPKEKWYE